MEARYIAPDGARHFECDSGGFGALVSTLAGDDAEDGAKQYLIEVRDGSRLVGVLQLLDEGEPGDDGVYCVVLHDFSENGFEFKKLNTAKKLLVHACKELGVPTTINPLR